MPAQRGADAAQERPEPCAGPHPGTHLGQQPDLRPATAPAPGPGRWWSRLRRRALPGALGAAIAAAVSGCGTAANPYFDPQRPHHRPDGFQNNHLAFEPKGLGELLRWQWEAWRAGRPAAPAQPVPQVAADVGFVQRNAAAGAQMVPAVTWLGHASTLVQAGGLNVLTDPVFSERASPLGFIGPRRAQPPGLALAQLPHIDLVLVSHNHYDHLDEASVRALAAQAGGPPLFIVPLGLKPWLASIGVHHAVELDWWQRHTVAGPTGADGARPATQVMLTPSQHWSGRGLNDRMRTLWGGFAVLSPDLHWFYPGDTAYSPEFGTIRQRLATEQTPAAGGGFDLALLPIGAYEPRWFMATQHVNPAEAVRMHRDLGAKASLGVHWGTFNLTDEPLDQPPRDLAAARSAQGVADADFFVLAVGQTRRLTPRTASTPAPAPATQASR